MPEEPLTHNDPSRYTVASNVHWSAPEGFDLSMDIYTPRSGKASYPVLVIFHGGGWLINDKSIMEQAAKYMVSNGEYVVCNVDYRLLGDQDNTVTLNEVVNDAFGAVLWVKENIASYGGDPQQVALTGDSAGAHLAAAVVNLGSNLSSSRYSQDNLAFQPSYLPAGTSAEQIAADDGLAVQAAILSYGVFDLSGRAGSGFESWKNPFGILAARCLVVCLAATTMCKVILSSIMGCRQHTTYLLQPSVCCRRNCLLSAVRMR